VKFVAVGRLVRSKETGTFLRDKHQVIASLAADPDNALNKTYVTHLTQIMNNGAEKLKPNKRVRLTSDGEQYDLHLLADLVDQDPNHMIVFFAVTDNAFSKVHSVTYLLEEFKTCLYNENDSESIKNAKTNGTVHQKSQIFLQQLVVKYGEDKLSDAQDKVKQVADVMRDSVGQVIVSVDQMDEINKKADSVEEQAKKLNDGATKFKQQQRCQYYKKGWFLALCVAIIILIIVISATAK